MCDRGMSLEWGIFFFSSVTLLLFCCVVWSDGEMKLSGGRADVDERGKASAR